MDANNATSVAIDVVVILSSGIIFQSIQLLCRKKGYPLIATKLFQLKTDKLIFNFSKQFWKWTYHFCFFLLELIVLIPTDFWISIINPYNKQYGTSLLWSNIYEVHLPSTGIRLLYLIQIGYYTTDCFYMLTMDKPKDWIIMSIHHISTLSLLWMSYLPKNCWKIGGGILLMHEIGDVSISIIKSLHYAQFEKTSEILFVFNTLIWIWSRLIWFPRIIASLFVDIPSNAKIWQVIPSAILLCTLLVLHILWTKLMFKVLYKAFVGGEKMEDPNVTENDNNENQNGNVDQDKDTVGDIESKIEKIELERTNATNDNGANTPSFKRRRSSLVESFIETQDGISMKENS